jgi:hypothetical protein
MSIYDDKFDLATTGNQASDMSSGIDDAIENIDHYSAHSLYESSNLALIANNLDRVDSHGSAIQSKDPTTQPASSDLESESTKLATPEATWKTIDWKTAGPEVYEKYGREHLAEWFRKQGFPKFFDLPIIVRDRIYQYYLEVPEFQMHGLVYMSVPAQQRRWQDQDWTKGGLMVSKQFRAESLRNYFVHSRFNIDDMTGLNWCRRFLAAGGTNPSIIEEKIRDLTFLVFDKFGEHEELIDFVTNCKNLRSLRIRLWRNWQSAEEMADGFNFHRLRQVARGLRFFEIYYYQCKDHETDRLNIWMRKKVYLARPKNTTDTAHEVAQLEQQMAKLDVTDANDTSDAMDDADDAQSDIDEWTDPEPEPQNDDYQDGDQNGSEQDWETGDDEDGDQGTWGDGGGYQDDE